TLCHPGGEELSQVLGLLGRSPVFEGEQDGIEQFNVDTRGVPAAIKVPGVLLRRNEAAVNVGYPAASCLKTKESLLQPCEKTMPVRCCTVAIGKLLPGRGMHAGRQISSRIKRRYHNTTF